MPPATPELDGGPDADTGTCTPTCNTQPGCLTSAVANAAVASGDCCGPGDVLYLRTGLQLKRVGLHPSGLSHCFGDCTETGIDADYNLWFGNLTTKPSALTGANDLTGDPLLSKTTGWTGLTPGSVAPADFMIQTASPAIDQAIDLGAPFDHDFFGTQRPQGAARDIGAHEY